MVDHEVDGDLWVHPLRVAAQRHHRISKGGDVDYCGNSREILQKHPAGAERDLLGSHRRRPCGDAPDVILRDEEAVALPQSRLEQDPYRYREIVEVAGPVSLQGADVHERGGRAVTGHECGHSIEGVTSVHAITYGDTGYDGLHEVDSSKARATGRVHSFTVTWINWTSVTGLSPDSVWTSLIAVTCSKPLTTRP